MHLTVQTRLHRSKCLKILKKKSSTVKLNPPKAVYTANLDSRLGIDNGGKKKGYKAAMEEDGLDGTLQCLSISYLTLNELLV